MEVNLWELRRLLTARVHESIGRDHNRINMVRASLSRPCGRVKSGHDEFTYPRQTPLLTGGRERTLWVLTKALKVKVTELLE